MRRGLAILCLLPSSALAQPTALEGCRVEPPGGVVVAEDVSRPGLSAGRDGLVITATPRATRAGLARSPTTFAIPYPLTADTSARVVVASRDLEAAQEHVWGPAHGRVGECAAVVECSSDDACHDFAETATGPCSRCRLEVPFCPDRSVPFGPTGTRRFQFVRYAFAGDTVFAVGLEGPLVAYRVRAGSASRAVVHAGGFGPVDPEITLRADGPNRALLAWRGGEGGRAQLDASTMGPAASDPEPPRLTEVRDHGRPRLRLAVEGTPGPLEGLASEDAFGGTLLRFLGADVLVYSSGLRAATRVRLARLDGRRVTATLPISVDGESGRAAADVWDERLFVAWIERPLRRGRRVGVLHAGEVRCEVSAP
ncbi:MAG: hypothetical protein KC619_01010 [Myxococcales bacterium]|nr:hypothetical protein [Myxococcales bacterium]